MERRLGDCVTRTEQTAATWDVEAPTFDEAADHGLHDPEIRAAWRSLLLDHLPEPPARIADLGCGTATLTLLLAESGHAVDGVDLSPAMVALAKEKLAHAPDLPATVHVGDAADPDLPEASYDVVLSRHVLWALPDPGAALERWCRLLCPGGRLLLVEGSWSTGAGLTAAETRSLLEASGRTCTVVPLREVRYWGREIADERYLVLSTG